MCGRGYESAPSLLRLSKANLYLSFALLSSAITTSRWMMPSWRFSPASCGRSSFRWYERRREGWRRRGPPPFPPNTTERSVSRPTGHGQRDEPGLYTTSTVAPPTHEPISGDARARGGSTPPRGWFIGAYQSGMGKGHGRSDPVQGNCTAALWAPPTNFDLRRWTLAQCDIWWGVPTRAESPGSTLRRRSEPARPPTPESPPNARLVPKRAEKLVADAVLRHMRLPAFCGGQVLFESRRADISFDSTADSGWIE